MDEQAVMVHLRLSDDGFGSDDDRAAILALEDALDEAVSSTSVGEFDGDEFGEGECILFLYGPDADRLFSVIKPLLESTAIASGGYAVKRYGEPDDPDAETVRVTW